MREMAEQIKAGTYSTSGFQQKYGHKVNRSTLQRWAALIRAGGMPDVAPKVSKAAEKAKRAQLADRLPSMPDPRAMTDPDIGFKINFLAELALIVADTHRQRRYGMRLVKEGQEPNDGSDDGWEIKAPNLFDASIKRRIETLSLAVKIMGELWSLQWLEGLMQEVVDIVVEEIGPMHPDIQQRIMERLALANSRREGSLIISGD